MKNVKKLLKKATVFAVAASMLVGTPLTASAAGIRGVYSISDGTGTVKENPNDSGTGTVTNTNTETGTSVLENYDAKIIDIVLDKENVNAVKGEQESLKATIILDGMDDIGDEMKAEIQKKLASKIRWEVSNVDGSTDTNPAATVSIQSSASDRSVVYLNPKKGTKDCKATIRVTAKIDRAYYWVEERDASGNIVRDEAGKPVLEMKDTGIDGEPYTASATVSVKEYSTKLSIDGSEDIYLKHTLNLMDDSSRYHLVREPATANDEITWISTNTKVATVTAAGVVTFKKVNADDEGKLTNANDACQIIAVGERGVKSEPWDVKVKAGTPASKVVILDADTYEAFDKNTTTVDLNSNIEDDWDSDDTKDVTVQMYAKVKNVVVSKDDAKKPATSLEDAKRKGNKDDGDLVTATLELAEDTDYYTPDADNKKALCSEKQNVHVTDVIDWSSNKPAFADVVADYNESDGATLTAKGVGTATIMAKASGGKKATLKVVVKATLSNLEIDEVDHLYSGQSYQMTFTRDPEENKDAVKWSIAKVQEIKNGELQYKGDNPKMITNPNATINAKGVLTIKPKLNPAYNEVKVVLESKTTKTIEVDGKNVKVPLADDFEVIGITQSSIEGITVTEEGDGTPIAHVSAATGKVVQDKIDKSINTREIAIPKNKTYIAVADPGVDMVQDDANNSLTWKSSNTKVAELSTDMGGNVKITAKATGTATITVSGIRAVYETKGEVTSLKSASAIKTTFKVSVKQPVKTVTLNRPSVVLNQKMKKVNKVDTVQDQKVALKATLGPKGVKKTDVHWSVTKNDVPLTEKDALIDLGLWNKKKNVEIVAASVSVNLPQPKIGDVFEITARTDSGASATSVVRIVSTTTGVRIQNAVDGDVFKKYDAKKNKDIENTAELKIGGPSIQMETVISTAAKGEPANWAVAGKKVAADDVRENVTYSVNKKGIVNIDQKTGEVYAIKEGKVVITAKTPLGKSAKLTVEVSK